MKKKAATKNPISISRSLGPLIEQVRTLVQSPRWPAATRVNAFQERWPQIWQKLSAKLALEQKSQKPSGKLSAMSPDQLLVGLDFFFTTEGAEYTESIKKNKDRSSLCSPCSRWCKKVVSR